MLEITLKFDRNWDENIHILKVANLKEAISQANQMIWLSTVYHDPDWKWMKYWTHVLEELEKLKNNPNII